MITPFRINKVWILFLCVLAVLGVSVSLQAQTMPSKSTKIGMLIPLSGQYAALGADCQQGIEIAKLEIDPGVNLDFVFADSKAESLQSVVEFKKLTDIEKVVGAYVIRGPSGMAVDPLSKAAKLPLLGAIGNKNFALSNEYAFQFWPRSDFEGEYIATAIHSKGFKKIAIFTVQDDYAIAVSEGLRSQAKLSGLEIVLDQEVLPTEIDFRSQIGALRRIKPDAVFLNVGLAQIAPMITQSRQAGFDKQIFSNFWAGKSEVIAAAGKYADGLMFAEMSTNLPALRADLKAKFNSSPSGITLSTYLATLMLAQATASLKEVDSAKLYASLLAMKEIKTKSGNFEIKDRFVQFPMVIRRINNGQTEDVN